ncbi:hypothetical protein M422DRAFT_270365 [Sphaerobolus stellatus SS14]|uniref:Aminoglycoside phosphotransferase domain-containing protein n=1 Tax=Sphaerobolus stellatus (strain SS14) TaxID=990650 RepID=A0A0C9USR1_SPHS4|nr:hypothetical protein M422DRAFT_270365 [Sphaerobolus stellatus SS14]
MEAAAYLGIPGTRTTDVKNRYSFDKLVELFDIAKQFEYPKSSLIGIETFHFSHGDLHTANILVDPATGAITGILDWEMAGFRPAWLAAVASEWFNDDRRHILTEMGQNLSTCSLAWEGVDDQRLRAFFRMQLWKNNELLYRHSVLGVEYRGFWYTACHSSWPTWAEIWHPRVVNMERSWHAARGMS